MANKYVHQLDAQRREEVLAELAQASSPGFDFFLLVVLSCAIATFGLTTNSPAVIIGAMLVASLMSPILGLSVASMVGERYVFRRALTALAEGMVLAIGLSVLIELFLQTLPFGVITIDDLPNEILARTKPTPIDLGIALAGGAAAAECRLSFEERAVQVWRCGMYLAEKLLLSWLRARPSRCFISRGVVGGMEWIEVRDWLGRVGWVLSRFGYVQP